MILIGGRIFVIFLVTRHVRLNSCQYWETLRGIAHTGILQELEMSHFDKLDQHVSGMMTATGENFLNF